MENGNLLFQSILLLVTLTVFLIVQNKIADFYMEKRHRRWLEIIEKFLTFKSRSDNCTNNQSK
jgi:hypothetical protein